MAFLSDPIWAAIAATEGMLGLIAVQYFILGIASSPSKDQSLHSRSFRDSVLVGASWVVELVAFYALTQSQADPPPAYPIWLAPLLPGWVFVAWLRARANRAAPVPDLDLELFLMVPFTLIAAGLVALLGT